MSCVSGCCGAASESASAKRESLEEECTEQPTPRQELVSTKSARIRSIETSIGDGLWSRWEEFVRQNRSTLGMTETALRYSSYMIPGRFTHNVVLGELVYASSSILNTLVLRTDGELSNPSFYVGSESRTVRNLKTLVTIVQHCQLFVEWAAIRNLTPQQRWQIILAIESFKAAVSLYLLRYYKGHMLIPPESSEMEAVQTIEKTAAGETTKFSKLATMYLDNGRGANPHGNFAEDSTTHIHGAYVRTHLMPASNTKITAEMMYLLRPVVYAALRLAVGLDDSRLLPFAVSLAMDLTSALLHSSSGPSLRQKAELKRRCVGWLWYLFRPPLFQRVIENPLDSTCASLEQSGASTRFWILNFLTGLIKQHQSLHFNVANSDI